MDQAVAYWQIYTIVRPQDSVRACENTVTLNTEHSDVAQSLPSLIVMTFRRLSSEDDSNPQRLFLVRPETSFCRALQIPSRPRRLPKASLWSVNRD